MRGSAIGVLLAAAAVLPTGALAQGAPQGAAQPIIQQLPADQQPAVGRAPAAAQPSVTPQPSLTTQPILAGQPPGGDRQPGKPANLCQELVTFVQQPAAATAAAAPPAPQVTTAVQAPPQGGTPPAAQPSGGAGEPQQKAGLSGPVTPTGPAPGATQAAPPPPAATAPKPSAEDIARVQAAARDNDPLACRAAAQGMRRAGVALPPPLLALAALDPRFLEPQEMAPLREEPGRTPAAP